MKSDHSRCVLVILDGARPDVLEWLLARGDLPHIHRELIECGSLRVATTVFPSTTGPAYVPYLLGRYPGPAGVPGIRWYDRSEPAGGVVGPWRAARSYCGAQAGWIDRDIVASPTLFDVVPGLAICSPISKGLSRCGHRAPVRRALLGTAAHFVPSAYRALDGMVARVLLDAIGRPWRFLLAVFPGADGVTHVTDPWHRAVLDRYRAADRAIGAFCRSWRRLIREPLPDLFLGSDHGSSEVVSHCDVAVALERIGIRTIRHPVHVWRRCARAAVMVSGNGAAHVYLEPRSGRVAPLTHAAIDGSVLAYLRELPGVDLLAVRDEAGGARVWTDQGCTRVVGDGDDVRYEPLEGDALELGRYRGPRQDRALLRQSLRTRRPDSPRQILQLFASPRSGDIVLSARAGFDLRGPWEVPEHRAGHGALTHDHMCVPIAANVPLGDGPLRTVDIMPTILQRLGVPLPDGIDGVPAGGDALVVQRVAS